MALLKAAAESKSTDAQTTLAHLYETGTAVEQSNEQAAAWYFKAADGVYQAQYKNRPDYDRRLFSKDHKNMILWFRKASDLGHEQATSRLAEMYENGHIEIGKKDKAKAIELYRKAASQGDAEAVTALKRLGAGI